MSSRLCHIAALLTLLAVPAAAGAHGSVTNEDDLCAIEIGYLRAHFKIYLPDSRGHDDFCEDLPIAGQSLFVMEYIHAGLGEVPVDFRIIRNVTGMGRFAKLDDVASIDDLDAVTVFYRPPTIEPDVFTAMHTFTEPGDYIGIVTAAPDGAEQAYAAVFPFRVGFTGFGYWPLIVALIALLQLNYLYMSGRFPFRRRPRLAPVDKPQGLAAAAR